MSFGIFRSKDMLMELDPMLRWMDHIAQEQSQLGMPKARAAKTTPLNPKTCLAGWQRTAHPVERARLHDSCCLA